MSAPKFTPGPWELEIVPGEVRIYSAEDCCIADLSPDFDNLEDEAEIAANGRLIAAAPDLHAALRMATDSLITLAPYPPEVAEAVMAIVEMARTALAKAGAP